MSQERKWAMQKMVAENQRLGLYDQPKREWVSLTDEDFEEILKEFSHDPRLLAVEIEARLTEKNI